MRILTALLKGESIDFEGDDWTAHCRKGGGAGPSGPGTRLGPWAHGCSGSPASSPDGTVLWMAPARAIETHIAPSCWRRQRQSAAPRPRIVAGLPVAVHDDEADARVAAASHSTAYAGMANYQRILEIGNAASPADAAIVGNERTVRAQLQSLIDAGATDIWAAIFPVGEDKATSLRRTTDLLRELVA